MPEVAGWLQVRVGMSACACAVLRFTFSFHEVGFLALLQSCHTTSLPNVTLPNLISSAAHLTSPG